MKFIFMTLALTVSAAAFAETSMKDKAKAATGMVTESSKTTESPTQLDDLIRGEMSAVKSYNKALEKAKGTPMADKLNMIKQDHQSALDTLKKYAGKEVKEDTESAGAWGGFTKAFTGAAGLAGNKMAMKALNVGEEHGINEYKEALEDDTIKPDLKEVIRTKLLPAQEKHIETLKSFM